MRDDAAKTVFVVSGPSGSGKSSLCAEALRHLHWLSASISHTTRLPRAGETEGRDYRFVDRQTFEDMIASEEFLEWAEVHGELYGSSRQNLVRHSQHKAILFEVDCKGAEKIREKVPDSILIFIMAPSFRDLVARIRKRGSMSARELSTRLRTAREEIRRTHAFDFLIINDDFQDALERFKAILVGQRCRRDLLAPLWTEHWEREIDLLLQDLSAA